MQLLILSNFLSHKNAVVPCYFLRTIDFSVYTWYTQVKKNIFRIEQRFSLFRSNQRKVW